MITCRECIAWLAEYLVGELSARKRALCRWHLGWRTQCSINLQSYHQTIKLSKAAFASMEVRVPADEEFVRSVHSAWVNEG